MKLIEKILIIISIIILLAGISIYIISGFNYKEGFSQNILIETTKIYIPYLSITTVIILVYLIIKYNKQGAIKVGLISILGIIGTQLLLLSIIAIIRMPISKLIFAMNLMVYVASIIAISAKFEENI